MYVGIPTIVYAWYVSGVITLSSYPTRAGTYAFTGGVLRLAREVLQHLGQAFVPT